MNMKKVVLVIAGVATIASGVTIHANGKSDSKIVYTMGITEDEDYHIVDKYLVENTDTVEYKDDKITIKLDRYWYNSEWQYGYCVFKVTQNDGKSDILEKNINSSGSFFSVLEDDKEVSQISSFDLVEIMEKNGIKCNTCCYDFESPVVNGDCVYVSNELKDNELIIRGTFSANYDFEKLKDCFCINVVDNELFNKVNDAFKKYGKYSEEYKELKDREAVEHNNRLENITVFKLKDTVNSSNTKEYEGANASIYVTPYVILYKGTIVDDLNFNNIVELMIDGEWYDFSIGDNEVSHGTCVNNSLVEDFKQIPVSSGIDVEKVSAIRINGNEFQLN